MRNNPPPNIGYYIDIFFGDIDIISDISIFIGYYIDTISICFGYHLDITIVIYIDLISDIISIWYPQNIGYNIDILAWYPKKISNIGISMISISKISKKYPFFSISFGYHFDIKKLISSTISTGKISNKYPFYSISFGYHIDITKWISSTISTGKISNKYPYSSI